MRIWNKWDLDSLLAGTQNDIVTLENNLAIFYKIKYTVTERPNIPTPRYLPKRSEKHVHTNTCAQMFIAVLFKIAKPK